MGKIKKLIENELIGGTQSTDVYPVTSVKAVYDENNERLDHILNRRGVVNISTNYNSDHIAEVLTLEQAINKVPSSDRVLGFRGTYLASDGWHTIIYTGESLITWDTIANWIDFPDKIYKSLSKNATFAGIATPSTNPDNSDNNVFYLATAPGIYTNFNGYENGNTAVIFIKNNGKWETISTNLLTSVEESIDSDLIANGAVTTDKIADDAVVYSKLNKNAKSVTVDYLDWGDNNDAADNLVKGSGIGNRAFEYTGPNLFQMTRLFGESLGGVTVGLLINYTDNSIHGVTQIYETSETLNPNGIFDGRHVDGAVYRYWRFYNRLKETFTPWKLIPAQIDIDTIVTQMLKDGAITTSKIANSAIIADKIAKDAISSEKIVNSAITSEKIHDEAITSEKIAERAVLPKHIYNNLGVINNSDLDNIKETGLYTYIINDTTHNLIVQNYPTRYCIQYQFTANNINRRYCDYTIDGVWTAWKTISYDSYNPNDDFIANSRTILKGVSDANKTGLKIGDVLNGRYVGFSDRALMKMYNKSLIEDLNELTSKETSYDLRKAEGDSQWDTSDNTYVTTLDKVIYLAKRNGGYNTGYGFYATNWEIRGTKELFEKLGIDLLDGEFVLHIEGTMYYASGSVTISGTDTDGTVFSSVDKTSVSCTQSKQAGATTFNVKVRGEAGHLKVFFSASSYFYIKSITILPSAAGTIIPGDAASLLYTLKNLADGETVNIPEGIYNIGALDDTDYKGKIHLSQSNVQIQGAGKDKTIISGAYLDKFGIVKSAINVSGSFNVIKDLSIITTYLQDINGQAPAVTDAGKDTAWLNCGIYGGQDTIVLNNGSHAFARCDIEGTVDFICGGDTTKGSDKPFACASYFTNCNLLLKGRKIGDVICAPQGAIVFEACTIKNNGNYENNQDGIYHLARPWGNGSLVLFRNCKYMATSLGYTSMSAGVEFINGYGDTGGSDIHGPVPNFITPNSDYVDKYLNNWSQQFNNGPRIINIIS